MNNLDWEIILNSGINVAEYHILTLFYRECSRPRKSLANYADAYFGAVRSSSQTVGEYEKAVDSCLEKLYIKVLSNEDCMRDKERWEHDDNQFCEEDEYLPGNLDFTVKGSRFYRKLEEKIFQRRGINPRSIFDWHIGYKWKHKGIVSILTKRFENIEKKIETIHEGSAHLLADRKLVEIGKPYPIGPWWITRFDRLDNGWRVDIKYR